jgi:hypothetical protein
MVSLVFGGLVWLGLGFRSTEPAGKLALPSFRDYYVAYLPRYTEYVGIYSMKQYFLSHQ